MMYEDNNATRTVDNETEEAIRRLQPFSSDKQCDPVDTDPTHDKNIAASVDNDMESEVTGCVRHSSGDI